MNERTDPPRGRDHDAATAAETSDDETLRVSPGGDRREAADEPAPDADVADVEHIVARRDPLTAVRDEDEAEE